MTVQLDWPSDVVERLTEEAHRKGISLADYILETILRQKGSNGAANDEVEISRKRREAAAQIAEIRERVKPDPEGWTSRDDIKYGRR